MPIRPSVRRSAMFPHPSTGHQNSEAPGCHALRSMDAPTRHAPLGFRLPPVPTRSMGACPPRCNGQYGHKEPRGTAD
ncbi:hypothetical protein IEO21_05284 [Rhodonia placenta]|uniref:Uncharacterized protein n=1 Tax=Rhodonia placenta TaxID=104341 RepID=A0A8H7P2G7_9APHY|nr:hypothetical protein IEO21_05284 [Postia placenta]